MNNKHKTLEKLKKGEKDAIRDYGKARKTYPENKKTFSHIRNEEKEHYRELGRIKSN